MGKRVELRIGMKLSDGYETKETFEGVQYIEMSNEEMTDEVKRIYKEWNDSEDEESQRSLISIEIRATSPVKLMASRIKLLILMTIL